MSAADEPRIGPPPGAEIPKPERTRLAYAELWMMLGGVADKWRRAVSGEPGIAPFEQWPPDDLLRSLAHTYGLNGRDLTLLLDRVGAACEARAVRAGFAEHWDPLPPGLRPPRSPRGGPRR